MAGRNFRGVEGKIAGLSVKGMIREVEQKMANGEIMITPEEEKKGRENARIAMEQGECPGP